MIKKVTLLLLIAWCGATTASEAARQHTSVTLLHFSDYHAHALPFYSEGGEKGGIARLIAFAERHKRKGALVFNGGDTMNKGAPAWSDKYHCIEWAWWNGIADAMAFGNHDADYGNADFEQCRASAAYPILSANTTGFERYRIFKRNGVSIGVFAIAGRDFPGLVTSAKFTFTDPIVAARDVVRTLRDLEHVNAVVMIGHEHAADDYKLAAAVPGIDVIFGSHSHLKRELTQIPGTPTWFISPFQYGTYMSVVKLAFEDKKLTSVSGRLEPIDTSIESNKRVARRVATLQRELEADPQYRDFFTRIATLPKPMEVDELARYVVSTMRDAVNADVALSTASSFRQALPSGPVDLETLRAAIPYDNEIVVVELSGDQLQTLLSRATADAASEAFAFATPMAGIDPSAKYRVAVTDYMARVSPPYRDVFATEKLTSNGPRVRAAVLKRLGEQWPAAP